MCPAVFTSTWLGSVTMGMGELIIKRLPLVKHIYSAAKQASAGGRKRVAASSSCSSRQRRLRAGAAGWLPASERLCRRELKQRRPTPRIAQVSAAVSPDNEAANSFRECVIIRHPRRDGEFAFAFITGQTVLQVRGDAPIGAPAGEVGAAGGAAGAAAPRRRS